MSDKNRNFQGRKRKDAVDSVQEAQKLYRNLRRRKVPVTLAAVVCVVMLGLGAWGCARSDQSGAPSGTDQTAQQIETDQTEQQQIETGETTQPGQEDSQTENQETQYTFRTEEQLADHFERHGVEMGFEDEDAYVEGANRVISSPDALHKLEAEDGDDVYYIEETNEFVVVSGDGYIRTYFEPDDGLAYYERQ